ncbi:MAG TPA: glycosyltransferase, partial [Tepidisphaeraceae bacterium]|nr:glycosyltransferase [Tepidisphaeraceae bacterium]
MSRSNIVSATASPPGRPPFWSRWPRELRGFLRFVPFAFEAARDRMRRTGGKAFLKDLPMLMRLGLNYYRGTRGGGRADEPDAPQPMAPYDAWLAVNRWTGRDRDDLNRRLAAAAGRLPKISVLMPVYNPPVQFLDAAIRSVAEQVYGNWELCIADDRSTDPAVAENLTRWSKTDPRIKVIFRPENGHISRATNTAAELATGDWLVFLDHDDELTSDALGEVALHVAGNPSVDFVYSDSDKVDGDHRRYDPEFKPDWSPELLLSYMYFTHLCAVRREIFQKVGGIRPGFEGSQDHDFALRATEQCRAVGHIPQILYHWRAVAGSTATSGAAKPESFTAGRRAIQEAFDRRGARASVAQPDWAA